MNKGLLYVITAPSGCGKGTVLAKLMEKHPELAMSVSATTRAPRPGEIDGVHYYYISKEEFEQKIQNGEMLEHVQYVGNYYGTPKAPVEEKTAAGQDILLEIEVIGGKNIKRLMPNAVLIFIAPPSLGELRARLEGRGTETQEVIEQRLKTAQKELTEYTAFDYVVVNDTVDNCVDQIEAIIAATKNSTQNMKQFMEKVIEQC